MTSTLRRLSGLAMTAGTRAIPSKVACAQSALRLITSDRRAHPVLGDAVALRVGGLDHARHRASPARFEPADAARVDAQDPLSTKRGVLMKRPPPTHRLLPRLLGFAAGMLVVSTAAFAQVPDYPLRKPGFWEMSIRVDADGVPLSTRMRQCVDAQSDRLLQHYDMDTGDCKTQGPRRQGSTWVVDLVDCTFMGSKMTTRMVLSGDFQTNTRTELTHTWVPPIPGMLARRTIEGRWAAAACPAGWQPGDLEVSDIRLNVLKMKTIQDMGNSMTKGVKSK
jgi:hypothetical protein